MQLTGYIMEQGALAWCGGGDEGRFDSMAEAHFEALAVLDRQHGLAPGSAEEALRAWVMEAHGVGPLGRAVLDAVLASDPRRRLVAPVWSAVDANALDALDALLKSNGLPRNAGLAKLATEPQGAAGRALALDGALLRLLPGHQYGAAERAWPAAAARLAGDDAARAKALMAWWEQTKALYIDAALHGRRADFDVLLVLA